MASLQQSARQWFDWLTQPAPVIRDLDTRRRSRLLAVILVGQLIFYVFVLFALLIFGSTVSNKITVGVVGGGFFVILAGYIANRRGIYYPVILILVVMVVALPFLVVALDPDHRLIHLRYLVLSIVFGYLFLSIRGAVAIFIISLLGIVLLPVIASSLESDLSDPFRFLMIAGSGIVLALYYQTRLYQQAQQQLRESEERFRTATDLVSSYTFTFIVSPANSIKLEWVSPSFLQLIGYSIEELEASGGWAAIMHPESRIALLQHRKRLLEGHEDVAELRLITKQGGVIWLRNFGRPIWDEQRQKVVAIQGAGQDITAQKEAELHLAQNEQRRRAILEAVPDLMFRINRQGVFLDYHAGSMDDLLVPPEEFMGKNVRDVLPPELAEKNLQAMSTVLETRQIQFFEYELPLRGHLQYFEARVVVSGEDEVLCIIRNITQRKEAEEQFRQSEAQKDAILNALPDLIFRYDRQGNYLDYHIGSPSDLLVPPPDFHRRSVVEVLPPDIAAMRLHYISKTLETGELQVFDYELVVQGQKRAYEARMVPNGTDEVLCIIRNITQRKQAQAQLQQSEARYRAVVDSQTELVCRYTPDLHLTFVNEAYARYLDSTPEQLVGQSLLSLIPPEHHASIHEHVQSLLEIPRTMVYEGSLKTPDGTLRWLKWTDQAIVDSEGRVLEIQGVGSDITRLKMTEDLLNHRVEELRFLQRIDHELGYTLEGERVLDLAMDMAIRRTGASACVLGWLDEQSHLFKRIAMIGESSFLAESLSQEELARRYPAYNRSQRQSPNLTLQEYEGRKWLFLPLEVHRQLKGILALQDPLGDQMDEVAAGFMIQLANRTAAALNNIAEYAHIQKRAHQVEMLYQLSYELSVTLNEEQVIMTATRVLMEILEGSSAFAFQYDQQTGATVLLSASQIPEAQEKLAVTDALRAYLPPLHTSSESRLVLRLNDPELAPEAGLTLESLGLKSALLLPLGIGGHRFTALALGESRYYRYFAEDEITLALNLAGQANVAMQRAKVVSQLQELEQVKSEMIRVASHDLRNPVAQIQGYVELLEDNLGSTMTELQEEYMENIRRGIQKMRQLLEDMLNLERVESQQPTTWEAINIRPVLDNVVMMLLAQTELKGQTYDFEIPDSIPLILGSSTQLEQAFMNLVHNAIKYTPVGGKIRVRAWLEDDRFYFEVEDNGYGIPEEAQGRLFQRFYRAQTPGTEHIGGTGLGLSLVKTVIERHGGAVFFHSKVGVGSRFGFWLPLSSLSGKLTTSPVTLADGSTDGTPSAG